MNDYIDPKLKRKVSRFWRATIDDLLLWWLYHTKWKPQYNRDMSELRAINATLDSLETPSQVPNDNEGTMCNDFNPNPNKSPMKKQEKETKPVTWEDLENEVVLTRKPITVIRIDRYTLQAIKTVII